MFFKNKQSSLSFNRKRKDSEKNRSQSFHNFRRRRTLGNVSPLSGLQSPRQVYNTTEQKSVFSSSKQHSASSDVELQGMDEYKIAILGCGGVGKSAITIQFIQNLFVDCYDPTIEDSYTKQILVNGKYCNLQVLDTAGQEEFKSLRDSYMIQSDAFICVYALNDRKTFLELGSFVDQIYRIKEECLSFPMVLVGNKSDLRSERSVHGWEAMEFAKNRMKIEEDAVFEVSAKIRKSVDEIFAMLVKKVREYIVNVKRASHANQKYKLGKNKCSLL